MVCLNQTHIILFYNEISIFSDHKNLLYVATLSEYQGVMFWKLIFEYFWPNIQHITGVDNIVADTLIILPYISVNKYKPRKSKSLCY